MKISLSFAFVLIGGFAAAHFSPDESYDKSRHIERYNSGFSIDYVMSGDRLDYFYQFLAFFFHSLGVPHQVFFFFIASLTLFLVRKSIATAGLNYSHKFQFIGFFLFFNISLLSNVRFPLALAFFVFALVCYHKSKAVFMPSLFFLLSIFTHFSLFPVLLSFVAYQFSNKFNWHYLFLLLSIAFLVLFRGDFFIDVYHHYSSAKFSPFHRSLIYYLLIAIPFSFFVYLSLRHARPSFKFLVFCCILTSLFFYNSPPFFLRYASVAMTISFIGIILQEKKISISSQNALLLSVLILLVLDIHDHHGALLESYF